MTTHLSELNAKQQEINNMQNTAGQATATAGEILKNYTAYKDGKLITGTMANNGAVTQTLNAGGSYTIPAGYHNGSGKVTANSLTNQTSATSTESDIAEGKTAWVNGKLITGTAKKDPLEIPYIELTCGGNSSAGLSSKINLNTKNFTNLKIDSFNRWYGIIYSKYR